jgi:APA family basic amino acid/polyamine antiporter
LEPELVEYLAKQPGDLFLFEISVNMAWKGFTVDDFRNRATALIDKVASAPLATGGGLGGVVSAASLIFFAFIGFDEVITLSEETRNPSRTIPRALFMSLAISTVLYALVAVSAVAVLGSADLAASTRPIADVVTARVGSVGGDIAAAIAMVATSTTVLLALTAGSRMVWALADKGHLHRSLAEVKRQEVPLAALVAVASVAGALILVRDLKLLAGATDALIYLMFLITNIVVIVLRCTMPDEPRPFRIAGSLGAVPVLPVLATVVTVVLAVRLEANAVVWAAGIVGVGALYRGVAHRFVAD